jgi:hypothetical protein
VREKAREAFSRIQSFFSRFHIILLHLRKRNERFFMAGRMLVDLIEPSSKKVGEIISKTRNRNTRAINSQRAALEQVLQEAKGLRKALLKVRPFRFNVLLCFALLMMAT